MLLTLVNLFGISESAKLLMAPTVVFVVSIFAVITVGPFHPHPVAVIGTAIKRGPAQALGILLVLKAFASGCSAVTGVEAIANGVPSFRTPRVRNAQITEILLGVLLGSMLVGLAILIHHHGVVPRATSRCWRRQPPARLAPAGSTTSATSPSPPYSRSPRTPASEGCRC